MLTICAADIDELATILARRLGLTKTEVVRRALKHELERLDKMEENIAAIQAELASWPSTGLIADKAFYDDLSGDI